MISKSLALAAFLLLFAGCINYGGSVPSLAGVNPPVAAGTPGRSCQAGGSGSGCGCGRCGSGSTQPVQSTANKTQTIETAARAYYEQTYGSTENVTFVIKDFGCHVDIGAYEGGVRTKTFGYGPSGIYEVGK